MAPLILHNVPDEERYIGDDGVIRPYAMLFPTQDQAPLRARRAAAEKGSFGRSTRRSRSKTGTPARREDPTVAAADAVFGAWKEQQSRDGGKTTATTTQRSSGLISTSQSQPILPTVQGLDDNGATAPIRAPPQEPTEVVLRGYRSSKQQYAAINQYEELAGRICEDYSRDPPIENRRYKSELRDPAFTRRKALTPEERAKVNRADGGEHWVKVTFESATAAESAMFASPQKILGHLVYCEPYHGLPPPRDEAIPDPVTAAGEIFAAAFRSEDSHQSRSLRGMPARGPPRPSEGRGQPATLPKSFTTTSLPTQMDLSPAQSQASSHTLDTATVGTTSESLTASSATVTGISAHPTDSQVDDEFCKTIPTVRRAKLMSAEQALLPQVSYTQRILNMIPFLRWFSGSMIGDQVPRTDNGEFDWDKASLYWKFICWLDSTFGLFGGEILNADKED